MPSEGLEDTLIKCGCWVLVFAWWGLEGLSRCGNSYAYLYDETIKISELEQHLVFASTALKFWTAFSLFFHGIVGLIIRNVIKNMINLICNINLHYLYLTSSKFILYQQIFKAQIKVLTIAY